MSGNKNSGRKKTNNPKSEYIMVRLTKDDYQLIKNFSINNKIAMSKLLLKSVTNYIKENDKK